MSKPPQLPEPETLGSALDGWATGYTEPQMLAYGRRCMEYAAQIVESTAHTPLTQMIVDGLTIRQRAASQIREAAKELK